MILMIADTIIGLCLFALFTSIMINFIEASNEKTKGEKKSIVETGTMTLFFIAFYALIRFKIGEIVVEETVRNILVITGLLLMILATTANIIGRFNLGKNWGNQIKIYESHTLKTKGMYAIVRHPLYASIMLMFYSACLIYPNYLAFLATTCVFIPFMYYRAKQEEKLLTKTFPEYKKYQKKVGMFFPKFKK